MLTLLPSHQRDDSADRYIATLASQATIRAARSRLEVVGRALVGWAAPQRPTRIGARSLHIDLGRVPWALVSPDDCQRVREIVLKGTRSRRSAGAVLGALRGVLRVAGVLTVAHLDALRVDEQGEGIGRSVRDVWRDDDGVEPPDLSPPA